MDYFQEALTHERSTILFGSFGRYPRLVKFYLEAIPELTGVSDFELVFFHHGSGRFLYVLMEPPFNEVLPPGKWCLVLTSHLRLCWNPLTTRVVYANPPLMKSIPMPVRATRDQKILIPPTSHIFAFYNYKPSLVDLSRVKSAHEAYLRLLTFMDVLRPTSEWSLSMPHALHQSLLNAIPGTGPYDTCLLKVLAW